MALHIIGGGRGEEHRSAAEIGRIAPAAGRNPFQYLAIAGLVGLQGQEPPDAYYALLARLPGFRVEALAGPLVERRLVRTVLMRPAATSMTR